MATNGMTINGLNPLSALTADDKIPVWDTGASGEPTKEITAQNMANSVKSLAGLPNTAEMNAAIAQSTAKFKYGVKQQINISAEYAGEFYADVAVAHGCGKTPTAVFLTPLADGATPANYVSNIAVTGMDAFNLTFRVWTKASTTISVYWLACV